MNLNVSVSDDDGNELAKIRIENRDGDTYCDLSVQVVQKLPNGDMGVHQYVAGRDDVRYTNVLQLLRYALKDAPHWATSEGAVDTPWNFDRGPLSLPGASL